MFYFLSIYFNSLENSADKASCRSNFFESTPVFSPCGGKKARFLLRRPHAHVHKKKPSGKRAFFMDAVSAHSGCGIRSRGIGTRRAAARTADRP